MPFPEEFIWGGVATAAHQIEGNNLASDWWARENAPDWTLERSGDACDSYHRYGEDIAIVAGLGLDMYRFSIEWARIEPADGQFSLAAIEHYRRVVAECLAAGVTPMVTLQHFTVPAWFADRGGWAADDAAERFGRYVTAVLPALEGVEWVCTINEPNIAAMMAAQALAAAGEATLTAGSLPEPDPATAAGLLAAHRAATKILRGPGRRVGWAVATQDFQAVPGAEATRDAYGHPRDAWYLEQARGDDWVGVQAYTRTLVGPDGPLPVAADAETTAIGWEYYPQAAANGVRLAARHAPGVPVFITENGIATADDGRRIDYIAAAVAALAEVEEVELLGYLVWSLLDNFEWGSWAPTFGLVAVDRTTFERRPKPSAAWYAGLAARNGALDGNTGRADRAGPRSDEIASAGGDHSEAT